MMDDRNGMGPQGGYIGRITNDAREEEMEENMGQVNTMIGNLRNMAIDMGSELENQNRQIDRINLKVRNNNGSLFTITLYYNLINVTLLILTYDSIILINNLTIYLT